MPRPRDLLQRFRLAGTPGAPAAAGVPADRVAEVSAELEPVLARLADAEREAERLRAGARDEAARRVRDAADRAQADLAAARLDADAEQADAAARVRSRADAELAAVLEEARTEADRTTRRAAERMPEYVDRVIAALRSDVLGTGR